MTWPFQPKKDFVKLLSDQTAKVEEGITVLQEFMEHPEDIFTVSRVVDDVMDYARSTAEEMLLFEVQPDVNMKQMVEMLHNATDDINIAVNNIRKHPGVCSEHLIRARKEENAIERKYREGLAELFKTNDFIRILKSREIYRHLSNAADRVVEASNTISDILVKMS